MTNSMALRGMLCVLVYKKFSIVFGPLTSEFESIIYKVHRYIQSE